MRRKLLFDCFCCQVSHNFKPEGSERTGKGHSDKLQTYLKATKVPKVARSKGVKRKRSILSGCFREGYAAGHVNLKGILAKHNNETNDCPVLLRLSSDLPLVWVQLFTIRWVNSNPMLPSAQNCVSAEMVSARWAQHNYPPSILFCYCSLLRIWLLELIRSHQTR